MNNLNLLGNSLLIERIPNTGIFGTQEGELLKAKVIKSVDAYWDNGVSVYNPIKIGDIIYYRSDDEFIVNSQKVVGTSINRVVFYEHPDTNNQA